MKFLISVSFSERIVLAFGGINKISICQKMFTWNISSGLVGIGDELNVKFLEWGFIVR